MEKSEDKIKNVQSMKLIFCNWGVNLEYFNGKHITNLEFKSLSESLDYIKKTME